ncbi:MAG: FliG C-terminal domain-containing protein [Isosphaeraceae bacterium]
MPDFLEFEDLTMLDGGDLRAVFGQVPVEQLLAALSAASPGLRRQLVMKLPRETAAKLDLALDLLGPVARQAILAQRADRRPSAELSRAGARRRSTRPRIWSRPSTKPARRGRMPTMTRTVRTLSCS